MDDIKVDHGYLKITRCIFTPLLRVHGVLNKIVSFLDESPLSFLQPVVLYLIVFPIYFDVVIPMLFICAIYFMLTVYMDSVFVLFTVLIAFYQVPRRVFYGYLSSLIAGLFITWLNCNPAHFSKVLALELISSLGLTRLVRLLDIFGKFRSSCPVDGLPRRTHKIMILGRISLRIKEIAVTQALRNLAQDGPHFYHKEGVFEIVRTSPETATILFRTKFHYFMKEFDCDEHKLGIVSKVFKLMFEDRVPLGTFVNHVDVTGDAHFHHTSPGTIINEVMSGEMVQICTLAENTLAIVV